MTSYDPLLLSPARSHLGVPICQLERGPYLGRGLTLRLCAEASNYPRADLAFVLLPSFFRPENLPVGLSLSDVDQSIARCDGTFFDKNTGALTTYAKGVLIVNAA